MGDSGILLEQAIAEALETDEGADAFLGQVWLGHIPDQLLWMRKKAAYSQEEVAARMGTTKAVVARMERDADGNMSLKRFLAYAQACGFLPCQLQMMTAWAARTDARADVAWGRNRQITYHPT